MARPLRIYVAGGRRAGGEVIHNAELRSLISKLKAPNIAYLDATQLPAPSPNAHVVIVDCPTDPFLAFVNK